MRQIINGSEEILIMIKPSEDQIKEHIPWARALFAGWVHEDDPKRPYLEHDERMKAIITEISELQSIIREGEEHLQSIICKEKPITYLEYSMPLHAKAQLEALIRVLGDVLPAADDQKMVKWRNEYDEMN